MGKFNYQKCINGENAMHKQWIVIFHIHKNNVLQCIIILFLNKSCILIMSLEIQNH